MGSPKNDMTPLERNVGYIIGGAIALDVLAVRYLGSPIITPVAFFVGAIRTTYGLGKIAVEEGKALLSENRERRMQSIRNERRGHKRTIHSMHDYHTEKEKDSQIEDDLVGFD